MAMCEVGGTLMSKLHVIHELNSPCSVWHPLQGPLVDWPLAVCDASTVDFASDTIAGDVVDREAVFENTQVHFNPAQKWYYLPNQLPSELLVFKNADSEQKDGTTPGKGCFDYDGITSDRFE